MRTILDCTNLLGDSLYLLKPVKLYIEKHKDEEIHIIANPGIAFELFKKCFESRVPVYSSIETSLVTLVANVKVVKLQAGLASDVSAEHYKEIQERLHIAESYAKMLDVDLNDSLPPLLDWVNNSKEEKQYFLIAPFSRSCSRHSGLQPNKTLDDWKWQPIISYLRRQNIPVKIMGAPGDRLQNVSVPDNDYLSAPTLDGIQKELKRAHIVISVDSGIGHFASALNVPTIILWPVVSDLRFIGPLFAQNTRYIQLEPNQASPAAILFALRKYVKDILDGQKTAKIFK